LYPDEHLREKGTYEQYTDEDVDPYAFPELYERFDKRNYEYDNIDDYLYGPRKKKTVKAGKRSSIDVIDRGSIKDSVEFLKRRHAKRGVGSWEEKIDKLNQLKKLNEDIRHQIQEFEHLIMEQTKKAEEKKEEEKEEPDRHGEVDSDKDLKKEQFDMEAIKKEFDIHAKDVMEQLKKGVRESVGEIMAEKKKDVEKTDRATSHFASAWKKSENKHVHTSTTDEEKVR
jgi:hypothetical protein